MTKNSWAIIILLVVMVLWTLLAWGVFSLLNWLPALANATQDGTMPLVSQLREQMFNLVPQSWVDAWLPLALSAWRGVVDSFPIMINWAGYAIWFIWGLGIVALLVLTLLVRSYKVSSGRISGFKH
ncbi:hypothetical protein B7R74_05380 [Yersinia pseudotuberculosis]|uniref:Uncharacterized protein n=2 Tax=Yersinia pseudotuberculosis complex TaxID=1649845 RepID=A0A0T9J6G1_YERPU